MNGKTFFDTVETVRILITDCISDSIKELLIFLGLTKYVGFSFEALSFIAMY